jgi:hypothetical protein
LRQFVENMPDLPNSVKNIYTNSKNPKTGEPKPLEREEAQRLLGEVLESNNPSYIALDALDEFESSTTYFELSELIEWLASVPSVRLFATGRTDCQIIKEFPVKIKRSDIKIRAKQADLELYLSRKLQQCYPKVGQQSANKVIEKITKEGNGM